MSKRKLLLADDSMTIQKVVNLTFADEGIEVFTVGNGSLAIERLSEIEPDLVLADVHMPGLTGYEVCEQIKMNPRFQHVPVMLLVGSFEPFDEQEARRVGANDHLTKPFQSIRQLIQKVTTLLTDSKDDNNEVAEKSATSVVAPDSKNQESDLSQNSQDGFAESLLEAPPAGSQSDFGLSPAAHQASLGDAALDDEMIETNSASNFSVDSATAAESSGGFETQSSGEIKTTSAKENSSFDANWTNDQNKAAEDLTALEMRRTEPLSYSDIQDINSSMQTAAPVEPEKQTDWEIFEFEPNVTSEPTTPADEVPTFPAKIFEQQSEASSQELNEEFNLELDSPVSPYQEQEEKPFNFDFVNGEETQPVEYQAASVNSSTAREIRTADNEPLELDLDEMNLLQIDDDDSILDLQSEEPAAGSASSMSALEITLQTQIATATHNFSEPASNSLTQVANQAVLNLNSDFPPHVIEAIAQLVVEKLSDKVIEKIAWEIVPDRFDLIVRKQMDNRNR